MGIGLRMERGSLITIVWTINFIVFSTRLAAIGKFLPKYISAYEMDGYKDVFIIFILRQQIPTLGSSALQIAVAGDRLSKQAFREVKGGERYSEKGEESTGTRGQHQQAQSQVQTSPATSLFMRYHVKI